VFLLMCEVKCQRNKCVSVCAWVFFISQLRVSVFVLGICEIQPRSCCYMDGEKEVKRKQEEPFKKLEEKVLSVTDLLLG